MNLLSPLDLSDVKAVRQLKFNELATDQQVLIHDLLPPTFYGSIDPESPLPLYRIPIDKLARVTAALGYEGNGYRDAEYAMAIPLEEYRPIILDENNGDLFDGNHRLWKARQLNESYVYAIYWTDLLRILGLAQTCPS